MPQKVTEMQLNIWTMLLQSSEINILAQMNFCIIGRRADTRCKIMNSVYLIVLSQNSLEKCDGIKPFIRRTLETSVIKIESININVRAHSTSPKSKSLPREALRLSAQVTEWNNTIIHHFR